MRYTVRSWNSVNLKFSHNCWLYRTSPTIRIHIQYVLSYIIKNMFVHVCFTNIGIPTHTHTVDTRYSLKQPMIDARTVVVQHHTNVLNQSCKLVAHISGPDYRIFLHIDIHMHSMLCAIYWNPVNLKFSHNWAHRKRWELT